MSLIRTIINFMASLRLLITNMCCRLISFINYVETSSLDNLNNETMTHRKCVNPMIPPIDMENMSPLEIFLQRQLDPVTATIINYNTYTPKY